MAKPALRISAIFEEQRNLQSSILWIIDH